MVISAAELQELLPRPEQQLPLVDFMESLYVEGLDLTREPYQGPDIEL